jgi:hypothetical protein
MDHHHHEGHNTQHMSTLSEKEKLRKLLEYWMTHNEEHSKTYLEWAKKIESEGLKEVVNLLEEASHSTMSINRIFKEALQKL